MAGSMAGKSQSKSAKSRIVPDDLDVVVREAVRTTPGLKGSGLKGALPQSYRAFVKEAEAALRLLVEQKEVHRVRIGTGKTESFFEREPHSTLDEIVPQRLSGEPVGKGALKTLVRELAPGHDAIFELWLKSALTHRLIFEYPALPASRERRYANAPDRGLTAPDDLEAVVREAVRTTPGLKASELKRALPPSYRAFTKEAETALRSLAERQQIHGVGTSSGKPELFFERDPHATLDEILPQRLSGEPLGKGALKALMRELAPGHDAIFELWLKSALTRRIIFEHAALPASKEKRYANAPDLRKSLAPTLAALIKALLETDDQGIPRHRIAEVLLRELGVSPPPAVESNETRRDHSEHEQFVLALRGLSAESPRQALLSVRDLRPRVALHKERFDAIALDLMRDGKVSLHHHDHPASLPEAERNQLVQDGRGNYYIGIAPAREQ
jgi:hypothetical protein